MQVLLRLRDVAFGCSATRWHDEIRWSRLTMKSLQKLATVWWCMPVIPATRESEAGESLKPRRQRLQWAKIMPLHSTLGYRVRLHLKKKFAFYYLIQTEEQLWQWNIHIWRTETLMSVFKHTEKIIFFPTFLAWQRWLIISFLSVIGHKIPWFAGHIYTEKMMTMSSLPYRE